MVSGLGWTERYRDRWKWDKITWGSHAVDCYPGGCPLRIYVRDGKIVREEQSGTLAVVQAGVPDMNPMGCNKGACWGYYNGFEPYQHPHWLGQQILSREWSSGCTSRAATVISSTGHGTGNLYPRTEASASTSVQHRPPFEV